MKLAIPPKDFVEGKTCCMCYETKGICSLKELRDDEGSPPSVKAQAMLLLDGPWGYKDTDKFCEECFWK